ncbi:MAG: carbohydrate-binding family 9-like protein [Clostridia bacterium]|nr:carbohydrate-binding family 9-like protein [Clostridia bacterium]
MSCMYTVKKVSATCWEKIEKVTLSHQPWLEPCAVEAMAQLCHDGENLYVRMEAKEENIRATLTGPLDQVCNDSCMEFFFAPKTDDARYFNFEWNKLCNAYVGFGAERKTRVRQLLKNPQDMFKPVSMDTADGWAIEYRIPLSFIRMYMPDFAFAGQAACNFYKCGDETVVPHYLAWAPLSSEKPDYHRRWDFGSLVFE